MRLLLFSDLGLDAPETASSAAELRHAFERVCDLARELGVDALCCAGNLYDQDHLAAGTADLLRAGFAGISPIPVFIAPGPRDRAATGSLYRTTGWSENVHIFTEPHLTPLATGSGITLWGAGHVAMLHQLGFLGAGDETGPGPHIALFHGYERTYANELGLPPPLTAPFHATQIRECGLHHALVGGIPVPRATADYTYAGQPGRHPAGEPPMGGAVLVTVRDDGTVGHEWHDVFPGSPAAASPAPPSVAPVSPAPVSPAPVSPAPAGAASANAPHGHDPDDRVGGEVFGDEVFGDEVFGKAPGDDGRDEPAPAALVAVGANGQATASGGADAASQPSTMPDFPESTVRGQFIRGVHRSGLSPSDQDRVIRIGLAAIDGHTDFGEL